MHQRVLPAQARGQSACGPKMPATTIETHMHIHMRNGSNATQHNTTLLLRLGGVKVALQLLPGLQSMRDRVGRQMRIRE